MTILPRLPMILGFSPPSPPSPPRAYSPAQNHWQSWQLSCHCQDCQWLQSLEHDPNCQWLQIADHCLDCQLLQTLEHDPNCQSVGGRSAVGRRSVGGRSAVGRRSVGGRSAVGRRSVGAAWLEAPRVGPTAWQVRAGGSTRNFFIFIKLHAPSQKY